MPLCGRWERSDQVELAGVGVILPKLVCDYRCFGVKEGQALM